MGQEGGGKEVGGGGSVHRWGKFSLVQSSSLFSVFNVES